MHIISFKNDELMQMFRLTIYIVLRELWRQVVWIRLKLPQISLTIQRLDTRYQDTEEHLIVHAREYQR